jgi:hypothetical protein
VGHSFEAAQFAKIVHRLRRLGVPYLAASVTNCKQLPWKVGYDLASGLCDENRFADIDEAATRYKYTGHQVENHSGLQLALITIP